MKGVEDPYIAFNFRVKVGTQDAAGVTDVTGLAFETEVETFREGGVNNREQQLAGPTKYPSKIVLKRGLAVRQFVGMVQAGGERRRVAQRSSVITQLDHAGAETLAEWRLNEACPIKWTGPELKAQTSSVAFEAVELVHRGLLPTTTGAEQAPERQEAGLTSGRASLDALQSPPGMTYSLASELRRRHLGVASRTEAITAPERRLSSLIASARLAPVTRAWRARDHGIAPAHWSFVWRSALQRKRWVSDAFTNVPRDMATGPMRFGVALRAPIDAVDAGPLDSGEHAYGEQPMVAWPRDRKVETAFEPETPGLIVGTDTPDRHRTASPRPVQVPALQRSLQALGPRLLVSRSSTTSGDMVAGVDAHSTSEAMGVGPVAGSERQPSPISAAADVPGVIETPLAGTGRAIGHAGAEQRGSGILRDFGGGRLVPPLETRLLRQEDVVYARRAAYPLVSRRSVIGAMADAEPSMAGPARKVVSAAVPTIEPMMADMPAGTSPWWRVSSRMTPFTNSRMATSGTPLSVPMPSALRSLALARADAWSKEQLPTEAKLINRASMTPARLSMDLLQLAGRAETWPADRYVTYMLLESRVPDLPQTSGAGGGLAAHPVGEVPPPTSLASGIPAPGAPHIPTFAQRSADESWAADWYASSTPPELTAPALAQTSRAAVPLPAHAVRGPPPATFPIGIRESISRPSPILQHRVHASRAADGSRNQATDGAFERQAMARDESAPAQVVVADVVPTLDGRDIDHADTASREAAAPARVLDVGSSALALTIRTLHPPSMLRRAAHGSQSAMWQRRPESMMLRRLREGPGESAWHASALQLLHLSPPFVGGPLAAGSAILRHGALPSANAMVSMVAPMHDFRMPRSSTLPCPRSTRTGVPILNLHTAGACRKRLWEDSSDILGSRWRPRMRRRSGAPLLWSCLSYATLRSLLVPRVAVSTGKRNDRRAQRRRPMLRDNSLAPPRYRHPL